MEQFEVQIGVESKEGADIFGAKHFGQPMTSFSEFDNVLILCLL